MKEGFVILLVILGLLALTAFRYRRQISGLIGVARMLKDVREQARAPRTVQGEQPGTQLVHCSRCAVWLPQNRALIRNGEYYCSAECSKAMVT